MKTMVFHSSKVLAISVGFFFSVEFLNVIFSQSNSVCVIVPKEQNIFSVL